MSESVEIEAAKRHIRLEVNKWTREDLVDYILNKNIPEESKNNGALVDNLRRLKETARNPNFETTLFNMNRNIMDENHKILKILVVYTGGTIGMQKDANDVYVPVPNAFLDKVRSFPDLHDPIYYNELIASGKLIDDNNVMVIPNVRMRVTAVYEIKEYDPLLDSSNMSSPDWISIAKDIHKHYHYYNGFVILHGTDTLCYTASALSFLLQNLDKPVIITGSQIPIFDTNSDAKSNFLNSIIFACVDTIKEVCVCFANKLTRGNRTVKISSTQLDAFSSPNYQNLARVEMHLKVYNSLLLQRENNPSDLKLCTKLEKNVRELRLTPMMTIDVIKEYLKPPTKGIVLLSYGYGNIPNNMAGLKDTLQLAVDKDGILIVNITQCNQGTIGNSYATSQDLERIGVIAGNDMTYVTALVKLSYVLGHDDWTRDQKIEAMKSNLCGEMTLPEDN